MILVYLYFYQIIPEVVIKIFHLRQEFSVFQGSVKKIHCRAIAFR